MRKSKEKKTSAVERGFVEKRIGNIVYYEKTGMRRQTGRSEQASVNEEERSLKQRFDTMVFPGGRSKAFTLSYDDGVVQDRRLAELFRRYGARATFNLNSATLGQKCIGVYPDKPKLDTSKVSPEELEKVYAGHEIAGHGLHHSGLDTVGTPLGVYEITEDKRRLEALAGKPLRMFAYPFGRYTKDTIAALKLAGYQGARTVRSTHGFDIPQDFLEWDPTCHHNDPRLMELARAFVEDTSPFPLLFYVWGHGYEFDGNDNWQRMEDLLSFPVRAPGADLVRHQRGVHRVRPGLAAAGVRRGRIDDPQPQRRGRVHPSRQAAGPRSAQGRDRHPHPGSVNPRKTDDRR